MRHHTWRDRLLTLMLWLTLGNGLARAALDPITNFAESTLATGLTAGATSFNVAAGTGAKFPSSYTYPLVIYNCTDYGRASQDPNVEIVTVTNRATDTFTVTRGQESTTAVAHNTAGKVYCVELNLTKGMWDRIASTISAAAGGVNGLFDCIAYASCAAAMSDITTIAPPRATLRISQYETIGSNLSIPAYVSVEITGSGIFGIPDGVTLTLDNPGQLLAPPNKKIFNFESSGTGLVKFTNAGTVPITWCGAVAGDATDDSVAAQKCLASLPSTLGTESSVLEIPPGAYVWNSELNTGVNNLLIRMTGATLDLAGMTGTGHSGVHGSGNVLAAIRLTGSRQRVVGGKITGPNLVQTTVRTAGVLLDGAATARVSSVQMTGLYACVWAGNNTTVLTLANVEANGCGYGYYLGYASSPTNPQVTNVSILNGHAHGATIGSGVLAESFVFDLSVIGGSYYSNAGSGIEVEAGGERLQILGVTAYSNTVNGIRLRYHTTLSGTTAGKWGLARRLVVANNILRNNSGDNLSAQLDDYSVFSATGGLEELMLSGNYSEGSGAAGFVIGCVRCQVKGNTARVNTGYGFIFRSLQDADVSGNQSWDNGTTGANGRNYQFTTAATTGSTPPNSTRVSFIGNHGGDTRSGGSRTVNFTFDTTKLDNSLVSGNTGTNANTADWIGVNGLTAVAFLQNTGTVNSGEVLGAPIYKHLIGSKTYDPPSTANNGQWNTTVTVTGAALGDAALCGFSTAMPISWLFRGHVTAADTVTCSADNYTGATVDLASGTLIAEVWKH